MPEELLEDRTVVAVTGKAGNIIIEVSDLDQYIARGYKVMPAVKLTGYSTEVLGRLANPGADRAKPKDDEDE